MCTGGTFFCDPPVLRQWEVCQWPQTSRYGLHRPAGQLRAAADVQFEEAWLVLHQNFHRVVGQLLTAVQDQLL